MKRWLQRIMNTLMALSLVLGILVLALWPVSVYRDVYFDVDIWLPAKWDHDDGLWYRSWTTEVNIWSGTIRVSAGVNDLEFESYFDVPIVDENWPDYRLAPNRDELARLAHNGYMLSSQIDQYKFMRVDLRWYATDSGWYDAIWDFDSWRTSGFRFVVPLWAVASIFLFSGGAWFTLVRRRQRRLAHLRLTNICLHCNYDLRGTDSETCPECGKPRAAVTAGVD